MSGRFSKYVSQDKQAGRAAAVIGAIVVASAPASKRGPVGPCSFVILDCRPLMSQPKEGTRR